VDLEYALEEMGSGALAFDRISNIPRSFKDFRPSESAPDAGRPEVIEYRSFTTNSFLELGSDSVMECDSTTEFS
jgi:hypothetical protein